MKQACAADLCRYPFLIWDMDGTILDSMPYWTNLGRDYLVSVGITPPQNLHEIIDAMTMEESARYFRQTLGLDKPEETIIEEIFSLIADEYRQLGPAKALAADAIPQAHRAGCRMCVLTTSDKELASQALRRVGLLDCFEAILSTDTLGLDKRSGTIYERTCELLGFDIAQTLICEDAPYAIRAAKQTKAKVLAVYDPESEGDWDALCRLADWWVK